VLLPVIYKVAFLIILADVFRYESKKNASNSALYPFAVIFRLMPTTSLKAKYIAINIKDTMDLRL
jgi:hypothetical protein